MPRHSWSPEELEDRFVPCLKDKGRGLTYGKTVAAYAERWRPCSDRTAKAHLAILVRGIGQGTVKEIGRYRGPEGFLYGLLNEKSFADAKEAAEIPPDSTPKPASIVHLGGPYHDTPMRLEWTNCPVTAKIVRTQVWTLGLADFMSCPICNWFHFLGVSPKMKDQRVYAWQMDPLVNAEEYADSLSRLFRGDPKTFRPQPSRIPRMLGGGHYVGLMFRTSWDYDPMERLRELGAREVKGDRRRKAKVRNSRSKA